MGLAFHEQSPRNYSRRTARFWRWRGSCDWIDIVERALAKFGVPIYVHHEMVHNTYVLNKLKEKGAIFIEDWDDVPLGATLVFST